MNSDLTPLYLVCGRFLIAATILLLLGLIGGALLGRKRGARAAASVQRATLSAVLASALLSILPEAPALWAVPVTVTSHAEKPAMIRLNVTAAPPAAFTPPPAIASPPAISPTMEPRGVDIPAPQTILPWALALWGIGAVIPLIGLAIGHQALRRMAWGSVSLAADHPAAQMMPGLAERLETVAPEMRLTPDATGPMLAGIRRPTLYMPSDLPLNETELRSALAHELAHAKHRDLLWSLIARLTCAALWFHPFMLLLARRMEDTAEEAADEVAMEVSGQRRAYADLLLRLAEQTASLSERLAPGAGLLSFRSGVGRRILRILIAQTHPSRRLSRPATGIIMAGLAAVTLLCLPALPLVRAAQEPPESNQARRQRLASEQLRAQRNVLREDGTGCLDARDAPTRTLLELLFMGHRQDFQIDNRVQGTTTLKASGYGLENLLEIVRRSSSVPLEYSTTQNVRVVKTRGDQEYSPYFPNVPRSARPPRPPRTIAEVPRRVAAIYYEEVDGTRSRFAAVLITGEDGPAAHADVVHVGSKVASLPVSTMGRPAAESPLAAVTLVVTRIHEKGLTLKYEESGRVLNLEVPLTAIGPRGQSPSPRVIGQAVPSPATSPALFPPPSRGYNNLPGITVDIHDAPIRQTLEMLFSLERKDFSIDSSVVGFVSLKMTDQSFESGLNLVLRASPAPTSYVIEQGMYMIRPNDPVSAEKTFREYQAAYTRERMAHRKPADPPRTIADVPRRVAAVAYRTLSAPETRPLGEPDPSVQAIIVTGVGGQGAIVDVVRVGNRVQSGVPGIADLRVSNISATGITLETGDGRQRIFVPMKGADDPTPENNFSTAPTTVSEASASESGKRGRTFRVQYSVPSDGQRHRIRIYVTDRAGQRVAYARIHPGGTYADHLVTTAAGPVQIRVYDNDKLRSELRK